MIYCEIKLNLSWSKECIISEISITCAVAGYPNGSPPVQARETRQTTGTTFQKNNVQHYVPVVTLSLNNNIKFLENIKLGFKKINYWNKLEVATQIKKNNLDYLIYPT